MVRGQFVFVPELEFLIRDGEKSSEHDELSNLISNENSRDSTRLVLLLLLLLLSQHGTSQHKRSLIFTFSVFSRFLRKTFRVCLNQNKKKKMNTFRVNTTRESCNTMFSR
jgi:hypothetical protein